jgi:hypothetical protein
MPLEQRSPRLERSLWAFFAGGTLVLALLGRVAAHPAAPAAVAAAPELRAPPVAGLRLGNGHMLAVQREPPLLVELGPGADAARGVAAPAEVGARVEPAAGVPLRAWAPADLNLVGDLGDLEARADGVWVTSGKTRTRCRLALPLRADATGFAVASYQPLSAVAAVAGTN